MNTLEEVLQTGFEALKLPLTAEALGRYRLYYNALEEKNKVMNLTAITGKKTLRSCTFSTVQRFSALRRCAEKPSGISERAQAFRGWR